MADTITAAPAVARSGTLGSIKVEPMTCAIGAELSNVNLGVASRDARARRRDPRPAAQAQGAVLPRPGHHARRARRFRAPLRRARGPSGGGQRSRQSGTRAHLQDAGSAQRPLRERVAHRRHVAREAAVRLRASLRRVSAGRRRHDVGEHGRGLQPPARRHQGEDRQPACAAQHRGVLRRGDADREAPGAPCTVSGRRASGRAHASRDRREDPVRQRVHDALHELPHAGERALRPGCQPGREPAAQLPRQPGVRPRVPGPLPLEDEQHGDVGQPLDAALRGHGLPAVSPQDGARRHRRRSSRSDGSRKRDRPCPACPQTASLCHTETVERRPLRRQSTHPPWRRIVRAGHRGNGTPHVSPFARTDRRLAAFRRDGEPGREPRPRRSARG